MAGEIPDWEAELWGYLSSGDGMRCPAYSDCQGRLRGNWCPSDNIDNLNRLLDDNKFNISTRYPALKGMRSEECCRIFKLIGMLIDSYLKDAGVQHPPIPTDIISLADENHPIEVHRLPLKANHGAIWQLSDRWIIQIKKDDPPARQRFTLFHEVFHILAHRDGTPVFKKKGIKEGYFNELLADYFAGRMLAPVELVKEKWPEVNDINRMAEIFQVPTAVMGLGLWTLGLIE